MAKNERTKNATRNIVWGILSKIIGLGLPFCTRTAMIYTLGMQYIGLSSLFSAVLSVLSFAELGIGNAVVFSMYKPIAEEDDSKVCALLSLYKKAYRIIGVVILTVGIAIIPFLHNMIAGDIPNDINLSVLFSIYLINTVLGYFLCAYKQSLFVASQRMDIVSKIAMCLQAVSGVLQITVILLVRNYYIYVIVVPIITCINNIWISYLADRYYPQYACRGYVEKTELKEIRRKVGGMVFQKIGGIVLSSVDTLVISAVLGLTSLALYQNYYFIITSLFGFLTVIMQSLIASVGNSVASESVEKNYRDFNKFNFIYIWIISWCTVCLLCLYQPFMNLWVGEANMFGMVMVILFAMYFFVHKWCDMLYVYQEACGIWWETKFIPLLAAAVNLVVNLVLVHIIGLPGILISTIVAVILIYDTGYASVLFRTYFKKIDRGLYRYWCRQCCYGMITSLAIVLTVFICNLFTLQSGLAKLLVNGCICLVLPNVVFAIAYCNLPEFKEAYTMAGRIVRKKLGKQ